MSDPGVTAVMGAMDEEIERLLEALASDGPAERRGPFTLHRGRLEGVPVVVAKCGIGKVNAAALTQALLDAGATRLIFTGVAGGVDPALRVGDLVVSRDAVQHDVDVRPLGYDLGEVPGDGAAWAADPVLVDHAVAAAGELEAVRTVVGRVASGDRFVADPGEVARIRSDFGAACAEMEGAAVAQVCAKWSVPWVVVRSISDTADHDAHTDFRAFTKLAAERAKRVVRGILRRLADDGATDG